MALEKQTRAIEHLRNQLDKFDQAAMIRQMDHGHTKSPYPYFPLKEHAETIKELHKSFFPEEKPLGNQIRLERAKQLVKRWEQELGT